MLAGLNRVSALSGSLLLNLEAPFTILIAISLFGEHLGRREAISAALIILGAIFISYQPGELRADPLGAILIAAACLAWGIDNNLSQRLSIRDPIAIVQIKTLGAGTAMLTVAILIGTPAPTLGVVIATLVVGALCYGLSLVFDMQALRHLGAAREAAYFATAPFIGSIASIPIFGTLPDLGAILAAVLMASGVVILLRERHLHMHTHEALEHDHLHTHDEHHQHHHDPPVVEPHSHPHRHQPMTHTHPHVSDLHHRHRHT
jgi:drug/metabolite transporter (DMT)-like permease